MLLPAITTLDPLTGTVGRRPSGARLFHRGSRFGPPEGRKLDRNLVARLLFLAEALDRRTRGPRQHGGVLKAKGLDVLRALLRRFYSHRDGTCFPSYDAIADAAGCARSTVAAKLRVLEQLGIVETIRRKVVASFTSRAHRVRFDVAVQTSNSYWFNLPIVDRREHGDLGMPLLNPQQMRQPQAESKIRAEISSEILIKAATDLTAKKARWIRTLLGTAEGG
jgi:DNA-binding MarR family transcriptional regulator